MRTGYLNSNLESINLRARIVSGRSLLEIFCYTFFHYYLIGYRSIHKNWIKIQIQIFLTQPFQQPFWKKFNNKYNNIILQQHLRRLNWYWTNFCWKRKHIYVSMVGSKCVRFDFLCLVWFMTIRLQISYGIEISP